MRPIRVDPSHIKTEYAQEITIGAPPGMEEGVEPIVALAYFTAVEGTGPVAAIAVRIALEPGDIEKLTETGGVWLTFLGKALPPFRFDHEIPVAEDVWQHPSGIPTGEEPCGPCQNGTHALCMLKQGGDCCCGSMIDWEFK
jgi:hypothetical protein